MCKRHEGVLDTSMSIGYNHLTLGTCIQSASTAASFDRKDQQLIATAITRSYMLYETAPPPYYLISW